VRLASPRDGWPIEGAIGEMAKQSQTEKRSDFNARPRQAGADPGCRVRDGDLAEQSQTENRNDFNARRIGPAEKEKPRRAGGASGGAAWPPRR
jgi:hypothetical protein